jgi:hypothetical protein
MTYADAMPKIVENPLSHSTIKKSPTNELTKKIWIGPIKSRPALFASIWSFTYKQFINVIPKKRQSRTAHITTLQLSFKFTGGFEERPNDGYISCAQAVSWPALVQIIKQQEQHIFKSEVFNNLFPKFIHVVAIQKLSDFLLR